MHMHMYMPMVKLERRTGCTFCGLLSTPSNAVKRFDSGLTASVGGLTAPDSV